MSDERDVEVWITAGVYDPSAPDAADRLELLEFFKSRNVPLEEVVRQHAEGHINRAATDHLLFVKRTMTSDEVGAACGLDPTEVDRVWLALGHAAVPRGTPGFSESDVPMLTAYAFARELFGTDPALQFTRVLGSSMARIAEAATSTFTMNVEEPLWSATGRDVDIARAGVEGLEGLRLLPELLTQLFHRHIEAAIERTRVREFGAPNVSAVGFVDLVGYTSWSETLPMVELASAMSAFEEAAAFRALTGGARLIKTIGDAVMFVAPDPEAACAMGLDLVEDVNRHASLPPARGAVAFGDLLGRDGDYFGPVVNLAARAVKLAQPGEIVADRVVAGFTARTLGPCELRGIAEPVEMFVVSR